MSLCLFGTPTLTLAISGRVPSGKEENRHDPIPWESKTIEWSLGDPKGTILFTSVGLNIVELDFLKQATGCVN